MPTITNWGAAILASLINVLASIFAFVPRLISFLVILFLGWIIAKALERTVNWLLRRIGFDRMAQRVGLTRIEQRMNIHLDAVRLLGRIVFWFVFLIFLLPAVDSLGLTTISALLSTLITYIPNVFVAVLIFFLGMLLATFVADVVRSFMSTRYGNPTIYANIARSAILGLTALMALEQLGVAPTLLNILFTAIIGALALAFGLAFGLGGRETAQHWLARGERNLTAPPQASGTLSSTPSPSSVAGQERGRTFPGREYTTPSGDQLTGQQVFAQQQYTEPPRPPFRQE